MSVVFTHADVVLYGLLETVRVLKVVGRPGNLVVSGVAVFLAVPVPEPVPVSVDFGFGDFQVGKLGPDIAGVGVAEQAATVSITVDVAPSAEQRELVCEHVVLHDAHSLVAVLTQVFIQLETVT